MKFTDVYIKNLKPEHSKYYKREANGFTVKVWPSGAKTWLYVYTFEGKRKEIKLGEYPALRLADARLKYNEAFELHQNGKDPGAKERQQQEERRAAPTVAALVEEYLEKHAKIHKRSWHEDLRILYKEVVPLWGQRKAADIKKRDVVLLLESIMDRGSPGMSNNTFQVIRKMFNFAVERDILTFSPATGIKALAPKVARERALSAAEVKTLWFNLDHAAMSNEIVRALKLVLVTAQRPGEVTGMHTREINGNWWTIPIERSKNGKSHRVYLTKTAFELIGPLTITDEESGETRERGYIFPSPHKNKVKPVDSHALPVAVLRNVKWQLTDKKGKPLYNADGKPATENRLEVERFTPHDLRRTAATLMSEIGFMDEIIDAVLNHVKQGVIKVYNLHRYGKEKQTALEAWERKLQSIVTGSTTGVIIPLHKAEVR